MSFDPTDNYVGSRIGSMVQVNPKIRLSVKKYYDSSILSHNLWVILISIKPYFKPSGMQLFYFRSIEESRKTLLPTLAKTTRSQENFLTWVKQYDSYCMSHTVWQCESSTETDLFESWKSDNWRRFGRPCPPRLLLLFEKCALSQEDLRDFADGDFARSKESFQKNCPDIPGFDPKSSSKSFPNQAKPLKTSKAQTGASKTIGRFATKSSL